MRRWIRSSGRLRPVRDMSQSCHSSVDLVRRLGQSGPRAVRQYEPRNTRGARNMETRLSAEVNVQVSFTVGEPEAQALMALAGLGDDAVIGAIADRLGSHTVMFDMGLREFLGAVRRVVTPAMARLKVARQVLAEPLTVRQVPEDSREMRRGFVEWIPRKGDRWPDMYDWQPDRCGDWHTARSGCVGQELDEQQLRATQLNRYRLSVPLDGTDPFAGVRPEAFTVAPGGVQPK